MFRVYTKFHPHFTSSSLFFSFILMLSGVHYYWYQEENIHFCCILFFVVNDFQSIFYSSANRIEQEKCLRIKLYKINVSDRVIEEAKRRENDRMSEWGEDGATVEESNESSHMGTHSICTLYIYSIHKLSCIQVEAQHSMLHCECIYWWRKWRTNKI